MTGVGAVVIGRNEGARLARCLASVRAQFDHVVYVDSGSTDDSIALATAHGVVAVALDTGTPFTAARARNAGFDALLRAMPALAFVQFIDGDCELQCGWRAEAILFLDRHPRVAVVCGRRRERHPEASVYNRLCDHEWDTPVGPTDFCGGDAMMRVAAFAQVGGFCPTLIAGEEPDLCHRLRRDGWTIHRIDRDMTTHDAAMTRIGQWWQRNRRGGYACAEALARRGHGDRAMLRDVISNLLWAMPVTWPLWPWLWWRIRRRRGSLYATFVTLGKLPQCHGQLDYWVRRTALIEYK